MRVRIVIVCVLVLCGAGCTTVSLKKVQPEASFRRMQQNAVTADVMSAHTAQVLRRYFLTKDFDKDPDATMRALRTHACDDPDRYVLFAMAELSFLTARDLDAKKSTDAIGYFVSAARFAYAFLFDGELGARPNEFDPRFRIACELYNHSLARCIRELKEQPLPPEGEQIRVETWDGPVITTIRTHGFAETTPEFDRLLLSTDYAVEGINNHYRTYGLGVPLIAVAKQDASTKNMPPRASYPASVLLQFNRRACTDFDQPLEATLDLYDPLHKTSVDIGGTHAPLESDTTTPLGYLLSDPELRSDAYMGLLRIDRVAARQGLYMIQPYEKDKIPVVLVHGLVSSPLTWAQMLNDLRGDPLIRERYQFWFFQYPTGYPIAYSSSLLRQALLDAQATYDPEHDDAAFNEMVLVGHSMGGVLSKLMVQRSGDVLWKTVSAKPFEEVKLSEKDRTLMANSYFFEPLPFVKRAIFIATPHRGSGLSDRGFATLIAGLIAVPQTILETTFNVMTLDLDVGSPEHKVKSRDFTSVKNLSPHNRLIIATQGLPIEVPYHSIIGNIRGGDDSNGTDGAVPYWSSRLDGAESEKIVKSFHSCHCHPLAILEVRRILTGHLSR